MSDDIVREFLVESSENLDLLDRELVQLEKNPTKKETLSSIFRTNHTIKGTCGFLGFGKLEGVAHAGENLLSRLRDGELELRPTITTALLVMVDAIRGMLGNIELKGDDGDGDYSELVETLRQLQQSAKTPRSSDIEHAPGDSAVKREIRKESTALAETNSSTEQAEHTEPTAKKEMRADRVEVAASEPPEALQARAANHASESSVRVDVVLLDKLMNLVGELVLARNQILQFTNTTEYIALVAPCQRLNLITTELQEGAMKTRMQPIGNIWSKFPRTVRDVATACGKQIRIEMEGKETELDKTIIEAIKDPLTHIVRNSADHGIESPSVRVAAGKTSEGRLLLRAFHEGGLVSYADFITLLFAFFVVLYSSSQIDKRKAGMLARSIEVAFQHFGAFDGSHRKIALGDPEGIAFYTVPVSDDSAHTGELGRFVQSIGGELSSAQVAKQRANIEIQLASALAPEIQKHFVEISLGHDGVIISLREIGFYDIVSAKLRPSSAGAIERLGRCVQPCLSIQDLELDRVTHLVHRGSREIPLSRREFALLELLMRNEGVPISRAAIIESIWKFDLHNLTNVVGVYINYLRETRASWSWPQASSTMMGV